MNQVLPAAKLFYETRLKINRKELPWDDFLTEMCGDYQISTTFNDKPLNADLVIFA